MCRPLIQYDGAEEEYGHKYYRNKNEFPIGLQLGCCGLIHDHYKSRTTIKYVLGSMGDVQVGRGVDE